MVFRRLQPSRVIAELSPPFRLEWLGDSRRANFVAAGQDMLGESSTADAGTLLFDLARPFGVIADEGEPKADAARCSKGEREMFRLPCVISV
jgi:hypothetical protein